MQGREPEKESNIQQFRMAMWNLRMLCEIQKESICRTNLEHFLESIAYILYIISKVRKSGVQCFKQCANQSWNEEVMAIWRQLHQARGSFRNPLWNFASLAKLRKMNFATPCKTKAEENQFRTLCEIPQALQNLPIIFRYFCNDSVRFLSQDILCNYLFSPCNKLKIF